MKDYRTIQYSAVPELECWTLPRWTSADPDELDDLLNFLKLYAPELAQEPLTLQKRDPSAIRFCIGTETHPDASVSFTSTGKTASGADALEDIAGIMTDRGNGEWGRIKAELLAIRTAIIKTDSEDDIWFSLLYP